MGTGGSPMTQSYGSGRALLVKLSPSAEPCPGRRAPFWTSSSTPQYICSGRVPLVKLAAAIQTRGSGRPSLAKLSVLTISRIIPSNMVLSQGLQSGKVCYKGQASTSLVSRD